VAPVIDIVVIKTTEDVSFAAIGNVISRPGGFRLSALTGRSLLVRSGGFMEYVTWQT
jgi:hypothetical protein